MYLTCFLSVFRNIYRKQRLSTICFFDKDNIFFNCRDGLNGIFYFRQYKFSLIFHFFTFCSRFLLTFVIVKKFGIFKLKIIEKLK
jgi:hypothetical protein